MKLNASVKPIRCDSRLRVPQELADMFDKSQPIYVFQPNDSKIILSQKTTKRNANKVVNSFMPYANGSVEFRTSKYFNKAEKVVIYQHSKDTLVVNCL